MSHRRWLVTGGLGFIGSSFVRLMIRERPDVAITVLDAMTYAGNPANVAEVAHDPRYSFVKGDIADAGSTRRSARASTRSSTSPPRRTSTARSSTPRRSSGPT
jgi:dTDP-D-glucose 4,6-dehydratase